MDKRVFIIVVVVAAIVAILALIFFGTGALSSSGQAIMPGIGGVGQQIRPALQVPLPPSCTRDSNCPSDIPICDLVRGSCVSCKTSVCLREGRATGNRTYCCAPGTGRGVHFSRYDDRNFECWTSCS